MKTPSRALGALGLAWAALLLPAAAAAEELRLSVVADRPIPISQSAYAWADAIAAASGGRLTAAVTPNAGLAGGDQLRELEAMREGAIDLLVGSTINLQADVAATGIFSLPFLIHDDRGFDAVLAGPVRGVLEKALLDAGGVVLAWGAHGFRALSNDQRTVDRPEDLVGLKIRVVGVPIAVDTFTALGATPVQMQFSDLRQALQDDMVDGQENPVSLFVASKMWEVGQTHLTLLNYMSDAAVYLVRRDLWEAWSPEDQALVRKAAEEAAAALTATSRAGLGPDDRSVLDALAARGVEVVLPDATMHAAFEAATASVRTLWAAKVGPEVVDMAEQSLEGAP